MNFIFVLFSFYQLFCYGFPVRNQKRMHGIRLYCDATDDTEKKIKISIESITKLFNEYLEEEPESPAEQLISLNEKKDEITALPSPSQHYCENEIDLSKINRHIKSKELLNILQNRNIHYLVKLEYIKLNEWLIYENDINLQNGGLLRDWNIMFY
jgi:hypothetical protein